MSKPTDGPWFYGQDGFNLGNGVVYARHANGNPKDICHVHGWGADHQANTRLIAATPDLFADLQLAAETLRHYEALHRAKGTEESTAKAEVNAELASRFESTIAKARGEA